MNRIGWWRALATVGVVADAGAVVLYLLVIHAQGDEAVSDAGIVGWAVAMAVPGVLGLVALVTPARVARWLLVAGVVPAAVIGLLAIFSVGLLFLLVAALLAAAAITCAAGTPRGTPAPTATARR